MENPALSYVIVVGVEFSEASELALMSAFELAAERPNGEVHAVNVVQTYGPQALTPDLPVDPAALSALSTREAREQLQVFVGQVIERFRAKYSGEDVERFFLHLRFDSPASELAQIAADLQADLVIVGSHGRKGLSRLLLGSTAEATVRLAPCPVLVVRNKAVSAAAENEPRIEPPCSNCLEARRASAGQELWCADHRERHGQRHTYHQGDRVSSDSGFPLVMRE